MLSRARILWRRARNLPGLRIVLEAGDRAWWARTIRRADLVDADLVAAQGHRGSINAAVRRYVRGGFRTGFSLNPLLMERLVASQLSDVGRVPALYAYLVNDTRRIETSVNWDSRAHSRVPGAREARGGPLGHAWREAVRNGHIELIGTRVAWTDFSQAIGESARRALADRTLALAPQRAEAVFVCRIDETEDPADAYRLAAVFAAETVPVIIALSGSNVNQWISATQLGLRYEGVEIIRDHRDMLDEVRRAAPESILVVRGPSAEVTAADLGALRAAASGGRTAAPAWLSTEDGTIVSAGVGFRSGRGFDILADHPPEDLLALDEELTVPAVRGNTLALPPVESGTPVVLTRTLVRAPADGTPPTDPARPDTDLDAVLAPTGFSVTRWARSGPVLHRSPDLTTLADGTRVPRLRWAIKIAAPPGPRGEWWGDTHFARGVAGALRRLGQDVVIDAYAARDRPTDHLDDVSLALRGPEPVLARPNGRALMWIISHPDEIGREDIEGYGGVFAASAPWAQSASVRWGRDIIPLAQCTDARLFRPHGVARKKDLVFVGTARGIARPSIIEPIRAGVPVSVYGPDWSGWISGEAIKGTGVPNAELPGMYESAGAVLNDHWPAMRRAGFISNRLYDVVAAGGRAISDSVDGIAEVFGGAVRTYDDIPELLRLVTADLDDLFPPDEELALIAERIRREHSFDARARTLLDAAIPL